MSNQLILLFEVYLLSIPVLNRPIYFQRKFSHDDDNHRYVLRSQRNVKSYEQNRRQLLSSEEFQDTDYYRDSSGSFFPAVTPIVIRLGSGSFHSSDTVLNSDYMGKSSDKTLTLDHSMF